jgi:Ca-activated chloride channel homolog
MTILQPLALLGLLTLPLIVLLHLLRERSKRAVVPSLELWRWLEKEVRGPRFRRIPLTWILLLQLLAALLLTAALLQPELPGLGGAGSGQRLIVVIDTSASMAAVDVLPSRLGQAQSRAAGLLAGLGANDSVVLISAGARARLLADSLQQGLPAASAELASLQATGVGSDWEGALALATAAIVPERANRLIVFTDGASHWPAHLDDLDIPARVEWYRLGGPQANQAVLGLSARPAGSGAVQVFAQIANFSNSPARREVTLRADGRVLDRAQVELAPSGVVAQSWSLPPGVAAVEVRLSSGSDVLPADDAAWLGVLATRPVSTLLVSEDPAVLERALRSLPNVRLRVVSPSAYSPRESHELTVFHNWLPQAWPTGGVVVVAPPAGSSLLEARGRGPVGELELLRSDPLLADVDLEPVIFGSAARLAPAEWLAPVLSTQDGLTLIWRGAIDNTRVVVLAFELQGSNIARRPAFPVLMANSVADVLPPPLPASLQPGQAILLPSPQLYPNVSIRTPAGQEHSLGPERGDTFAHTAQPGLYSLRGQSSTGETWQASVGVNAGDANEAELRRNIRPAFAGAETGGQPGPPQPLKLWPLAIALVLAVMLFEARLAWR